MSDRCGAFVKRVPITPEGDAAEDHAYLQVCGKPVKRDGLCATHLRKQHADERPLLRLLRKIGRW